MYQPEQQGQQCLGQGAEGGCTDERLGGGNVCTTLKTWPWAASERWQEKPSRGRKRSRGPRTNPVPHPCTPSGSQLCPAPALRRSRGRSAPETQREAEPTLLRGQQPGPCPGRGARLRAQPAPAPRCHHLLKVRPPARDQPSPRRHRRSSGLPAPTRSCLGFPSSGSQPGPCPVPAIPGEAPSTPRLQFQAEPAGCSPVPAHGGYPKGCKSPGAENPHCGHIATLIPQQEPAGADGTAGHSPNLRGNLKTSPPLQMPLRSSRVLLTTPQAQPGAK